MDRGRLARIAIVAVAYVIAGKFGLSFASLNASASAVWPPTGIAIAALLILGPAAWPGVLIGAFVVNLTTAGTVTTSLGIAIGNTLEGVAGAWLTMTFAGGRRAFERARDVLAFTASAAMLATAISATVGVATLALAGFAEPSAFAAVWTTWWLGDAAGALIVTPLILTWANRPSVRAPRASLVEAMALGAVLVIVGLALFGGIVPLSLARYPIAFVTFPVLVWAAYRFGPRGAATAIFVLSAIGISGTLAGKGPFARDEPNEALLLLQSFMAVAALTSLALAAAEYDRRRTEADLRAREEQLRKAEEHKVEEREEFLSVAAHELRTPITSLQLAVQILLRQIEKGAVVGSEDLKRVLVPVNEQSAKLARLVSQLLDGVRVDSGRMTIARETVDVSALVTTVVAQVSALAANRDIVFIGGPALARVDPLRIEQVLRNVLDNAVKFSPRGRIDVSVGMRDADVVTISVRDRGIGVPPEHRALIFQRYQQARSADQPSGLGLGLYVSRQIVELHGGRIEAEFPADGGTRIVITLPAELVTAAEVRS